MKKSTSGRQFLEISYQLENNGFKVAVFGRNNYQVNYPKKIFSSLGQKTRRALASNFVYCRTRPLSLMINQKLRYDFGRPALQPFVDYGVKGDLPRIAFFNHLSTKKLISSFANHRPLFSVSGKKEKILPNTKTTAQRAILAMSFGKDSLLTYGLAKELGLDIIVAYITDLEGAYIFEENHKKKIIEKFLDQERVKFVNLSDGVDELFYHRSLKQDIGELDNANGMGAFILELIPLAYYYGAKYLVFGNEANFSDYFNQQGFKAYPSFDQTAPYTNRLNQYLNKLTGSNIEVVSLVEPIYNLLEMRILVRRYPHLLPFMMSCELQRRNDDKWCYRCSMCAKAFLYLVAVGGQPRKIGFKKDFFAKRYADLYPLFAKKITRAYEMPPAVRDEQLLAFLLVFRRGVKGDLISLFKTKYLKEAQRRQNYLKKKFLGIHPSLTIPQRLRRRIINIYREELRKFYEKW